MIRRIFVEPMPFDFESIEIAENGDVTITWPVEAGADFGVQRGTDLKTFDPIGTATVGTFTDTDPEAVRAFYKVVASLPR